MTTKFISMTTLYKLTDANGRTKNDTQWGVNVTHSGTGEGELCSAGYIHAYEHPLIAVLMNPIHGGFSSPQLWLAEGEIALRGGQLKCGCVSLTTLRQIDVPVVTTEMRVRFAILCALEVYHDPAFVAWANAWLDGTDRTAARAAEAAAEAAPAWEAAREAAWEAAWEAARAAEAAWEAARAAEAAEAAEEAAEAAADIDFVALAERACEGYATESEA